MPTAGMNSYGVTLTVDDGGTGASSGNQTALAELEDIGDGMDIQVTASEFKRLDAPSRTIEKKPGMVKMGDIKCKATLYAGSYVRALALLGVAHTYKIRWNDSLGNTTSSDSFSGFLSGIKQSIPSADSTAGMMYDITITPAGPNTFTAAT